jgi:large conductance mechanosensitive channel
LIPAVQAFLRHALAGNFDQRANREVQMLQGFRDFLLRGNVVDLAVAVIIGGAFGKIVEGFLKAIVNPLIALLFGSSDPAKSFETIAVGPFPLGVLISAIINFILIGAVVYFFLVRPFGSISAKLAANTPPPPDVQLLTEIRDLLKK